MIGEPATETMFVPAQSLLASGVGGHAVEVDDDVHGVGCWVGVGFEVGGVAKQGLKSGILFRKFVSMPGRRARRASGGSRVEVGFRG